MEENILDIVGLQLVHYFINSENYQPYNASEKFHNETKGKVYLINKKNKKYQVIKIIKQNIYDANEIKTKDDQILELLKNDLALDHDFKVLILVLNVDQQNEFRQSPSVDVVISTPDKIVSELTSIFPTITKAIKTDEKYQYEEEKQDENVQELSEREKEWKKINFQNRHFLKDALLKATNSRLIITWLFFCLPIITYLVFRFVILDSNKDIFIKYFNSEDLINLVFGASNRNLVFAAHQYWRWFTFPFVQIDFNMLIFSLWMFYRVGRYVEGFYGIWKAAVIWVGAIFLTGIIQTTVDHFNILNGFEILSLVSIGAMIPIIWNYRLFKSPVTNKLVTNLLLLFLYWMFFSEMQLFTLLYWSIALVSGCLLGAIVSYHNRKLTVFYAFSPVAIGLLVLFAVLVTFLNPYYHFDDQNFTRNTLDIYHHFKLVSQSFIDHTMKWYFGI